MFLSNNYPACTVLHVIENPISKYTLHVLISTLKWQNSWDPIRTRSCISFGEGCMSVIHGWHYHPGIIISVILLTTHKRPLSKIPKASCTVLECLRTCHLTNITKQLKSGFLPHVSCDMASAIWLSFANWLIYYLTAPCSKNDSGYVGNLKKSDKGPFIINYLGGVGKLVATIP